MSKKLLLVILFVLAFLERTVFDLGPNIELVTMAMILASFYLGQKQAFWLVFAIMAFSDRIIGNSSIFLFTWSGFLIPTLLANNIIKKLILRLKLKLPSLTLTGFVFNFFFYLWTNFGVWLLDSWGMYPKTAQGLLMSYVNGLPFLRYQLTSTLIFVPIGFLITELAIVLSKKFRPSSLSHKSLV